VVRAIRFLRGPTFLVAVLAAVCMLVAPLFAARQPALTGSARLARAYDAIFDARFDDVPRLLEEACGPRTASSTFKTRRPDAERAPEEACQLLDVVSLWWQMQLDPENRSNDTRFSTRVDATIDALEAWTEEQPDNAEAWFYLGGAYGARAQWQVVRGERLAAAREGKRIKQALERALALDEHLHDAWFGIGLYHYYADVAPTAAKMLRWLLALPGGDRVGGLTEMLRTQRSGELLRDEADYQLHLIYLWYEKQPDRALVLLKGLAQAHPRNPLFAAQAADVEDVYLSDFAASLASWRAVYDAARGRRVADAEGTEVRARLGMARQLDALYETDLAIEHLRAVVSARPAAPFASYAFAELRLGQSLDRMGQRSDAVAAYRRALEALPARDPLNVEAAARAGLRTAPNADTALAYRLSLEGSRATDRGDLTTAGRLLARSLSLRPDDQVTRYRQARLLDARNEDLAAIELYESVMSAGELTPPTVFASASLHAARLYEQQRDQTRAIELYERAQTAFGVDAATRTAATRALARLTK
jgi:tetratricopeptide (TPR) repeat protein